MEKYNFNSNDLKYFTGMVTIGYFMPTMFSKMFGGYKNIKNGLNAINFAIVITLSLSTFFITSLSSINFTDFNSNGLLYLGFVIGLIAPFIMVNSRYMIDAQYRKNKLNKLNFKFIIYLFLLFSIIGLNLAHSGNYFNLIFYLIFITIIGIIIMIVQSNKKYVGSHDGIVSEDLDDTVYQNTGEQKMVKNEGGEEQYSCTRVNKNDYFFRLDYGFISWITSLLFIFTSNNLMIHYVMTLLQGYFIGIYVAWFSYFRS